MIKRRVYQAVQASAPAIELATLVGAKRLKAKARAKVSGPSTPRLEPLMEQVTAIVKQQAPLTTPLHVLAVYAWLHEQLYGVRPEELFGNSKAARLARAGALSRVRAVAKKYFGGELAPFVEFLAWCAGRERDRIVRNGNKDFRIGWRLQFSEGYLTDWRAAKARSK